MKELSKKLSLVLVEYNELSLSIQKNIDYYKKENEVRRLKGDLRLLEINEKYLYVSADLFDESLLRLIYGTRIDRTNEDSFDTLLYDYFTWLGMSKPSKLTEEKLTTYIKGMEIYAETNSVENLWHLLNMTKQCIIDSYQPNFSSLLGFYSIIELLILKDTKNKKIVVECGRKLPYFYKNINLLNFPEQYYLNQNLSEREIFENLTRLRHKVIHGVFSEARNILELLFPITNGNNSYMGNTEDAESSEFQNQIQNLNGLLRNELVQILSEWMSSPIKLASIKSNLRI